MGVRYFVIFMLFLFLASCSNDKVQDNPQKSQSLTEKVDKLQSEIDSLDEQVSALKLQLGTLTDGSATISTEDKRYDIAQTKFGSFAVVCRSVTQYLDGYKIKLGIGNLTTASYRGAKIKIYWKANLCSKEIDVTDIFTSGKYTTVEAILTPAKPEDVKELIVILDFNTITLLK